MTRPMPGPPECDITAWPHESMSFLEFRDCARHRSSFYDKRKRLSDAECAAEYWRAASDFRDRLRHGWPGDDLDPEHSRRLIWHRFASHPHTHEDTP